MPRLFTGLDIPDAVQQELVDLQRFPIPGAHPAARDDLHVTLHYVSDVTDDQFASICAALAEVTQSPFSLELHGVGYFPPGGVPHFLWAGVEKGPQLTSLYDAIGSVLVGLGFELEQRPYNPHVTLMRLDTPDAAAVERFVQQHRAFHSHFDVERFVLYSKSEDDDEARYVKNTIYPLTPPKHPI